MKKADLWINFDGVISTFDNGWKGIKLIVDPPRDGVLEFLKEAVKRHATVHVFSEKRSGQYGGVRVMKEWCVKHFGRELTLKMNFPTSKPKEMVEWFDTFLGSWPVLDKPYVEAIDDILSDDTHHPVEGGCGNTTEPVDDNDIPAPGGYEEADSIDTPTSSRYEELDDDEAIHPVERPESIIGIDAGEPVNWVSSEISEGEDQPERSASEEEE